MSWNIYDLDMEYFLYRKVIKLNVITFIFYIMSSQSLNSEIEILDKKKCDKW